MPPRAGGTPAGSPPSWGLTARLDRSTWSSSGKFDKEGNRWIESDIKGGPSGSEGPSFSVFYSTAGSAIQCARTPGRRAGGAPCPWFCKPAMLRLQKRRLIPGFGLTQTTLLPFDEGNTAFCAELPLRRNGKTCIITDTDDGAWSGPRPHLGEEVP